MLIIVLLPSDYSDRDFSVKGFYSEPPWWNVSHFLWELYSNRSDALILLLYSYSAYYCYHESIVTRETLYCTYDKKWIVKAEMHELTETKLLSQNSISLRLKEAEREERKDEGWEGLHLAFFMKYWWFISSSNLLSIFDSACWSSLPSRHSTKIIRTL